MAKTYKAHGGKKTCIYCPRYHSSAEHRRHAGSHGTVKHVAKKKGKKRKAKKAASKKRKAKKGKAKRSKLSIAQQVQRDVQRKFARAGY